jgi:putative heme-binding domain-containing protein
MRRAIALLALIVVTTAVLNADEAAKPASGFTLNPGDHICIIGNSLAERMQHDGWLETLLYARFPKHNLVIRNLGYPGDEVAGYLDRPNVNFRMRSMDYGSADQWLSANAPIPQPRKLTTLDHVRQNRFELTETKADVIFAFFGYNESFAGEAGLPKFKEDLQSFIKHVRSQKYNGESPPRLVLFSPTALERQRGEDGMEAVLRSVLRDRELQLCGDAMREVAQANHVAFVDYIAARWSVYRNSHGEVPALPYTIDGVHFNEAGNEWAARATMEQLFHVVSFDAEPRHLEKLRQVILDKNFYWFNRYRTTDGYSTYGDRAFLRFAPDNQSNYEVVQRELEVIDVMTHNRDKRIWALASGVPLPAGDPALNDSNTPPFIPVKTNKPGPLPGGKHVYLDPEEAIKSMTVAKNMKVNLFASEKEFPELANPVQACWDPQGRLWVAVWPTYPHWRPKEEMNDKILILEDTKGTGKADKCTVFADHLSNPTGMEFVPGGILVAQGPAIMFIENKDGKAGRRERVIDGVDTADTHHTANSFALDPGGAVYFQEGTFHHTQVETPWGPPVRNANAGVYRYEPRTHKFDVYVTFGFANPHGHVFDHWGQDVVIDGTGAQAYHGALFSGHLDYPQKHKGPPQIYQQRTRPCPGVEILSSRHFPESMQGNLLVPNVIGFQGILEYKFHDQGASFGATEQAPILSSTDPNFRPSDVKIGPDGAIYFLDWHNPIIGHMQHNLRDPSRDREHGRIYRVTYEGRPLLKSPAIAGQPLTALLDCLKEPEDRVRYRARIELANRDTGEVMKAADQWLAALNKSDLSFEHFRLEDLWLHQSHNVVNELLLLEVLQSNDFRARAAATRVLCYWRDRISRPLELLKEMAADPHPRVRLEAIRAASFFNVPEAVEVVLISAEKPSDVYLDYVRGETMRQLDPVIRTALASGKTVNFTSDAGARYFLRTLSVDQLLKMTKTRAIDLELLFRRGVRDEDRKNALADLAKRDGKPPLEVLIAAIRQRDDQPTTDDSVAFDLLRLLTSGDMTGVRGDLEKLATTARQPLNRQLGYVALIAADNSVDPAWAVASKSAGGLQDLLAAMPLLRDPGQRAALYPKVEPLLNGLPAPLAGNNSNTVRGRYVRVEIPGKNRTLSLAEVEVMSGGKNVARGGKASQKNVGSGGVPRRAIDGNTSGRYADLSVTHTQENIDDPWWEVDLGAVYPIDSINVFNRTDGSLGQRLNGYSLLVLGPDRDVVYQQLRQPAPAVKATFNVTGSSPESAVRRAAMTALTAVRGQEERTFKALAPFVTKDRDRPAAVAAMLRIPPQHWPADSAQPLLDAILAHVRSTPPAMRTLPVITDEMQLADSLAALLPKDQAKAIRRELGNLGVSSLRIGTVTDQMLFDKERLAVRAGKPAEIIFENTDLMPHNFVLIQPGSLEEVGTIAEAQATEPGALERNYVPKTSKIILASRLIQPRDSQTLSFTAPTQPGIYPYVCTYPGHWRRMFGALYVVDDLDEYRADPEGYLAAHPLSIRDELLKFNRPRKEWTFAELEPIVPELSHGRSFNNGKQMFTVANCVACHKVNNVGAEIGPDLMKLEAKYTPGDILRDILEPSWRIDEKFQTFIFELKSGQTVTGLILEETPTRVKVIENPLAKAEPVIVDKSDIQSREKSPNSMMPKGLLDKLTREEILDLVAYVVARGDAKSAVYHDAGHQHGGGPGH